FGRRETARRGARPAHEKARAPQEAGPVPRKNHEGQQALRALRLSDARSASVDEKPRVVARALHMKKHGPRKKQGPCLARITKASRRSALCDSPTRAALRSTRNRALWRAPCT